MFFYAIDILIIRKNDPAEYRPNILTHFRMPKYLWECLFFWGKKESIMKTDSP